MNIVEALKSLEHYIVLQRANGKKWMFWDNESQTWVVKEKDRLGKKRIIIETESEEKAVEELLK